MEHAVGIVAGIVGGRHEDDVDFRLLDAGGRDLGRHIRGLHVLEEDPAPALGQGEIGPVGAEAEGKAVVTAHGHHLLGRLHDGGIFIAVKIDLIRIGEAEVREHHFPEAQGLHLQHHRGHPVEGGGIGGIQPVAAAGIGPEALPVAHIEAVGHMVEAVVIVPEGADPGDGIEAPLLHQLDQLVHRGRGHALGADAVGEVGGIIEGAVAALQVDHDRGAHGQPLDIGPDGAQILGQVVGGDVVAVQLGQGIAQLDGVVAFVIVDGNFLVGLGRHGHLTEEVVGAVAQVQHGAVPGIDHVALGKDDPAEPKNGQGHQKHQRSEPDPVDGPPGTVGDLHKGTPCL